MKTKCFVSAGFAVMVLASATRAQRCRRVQMVPLVLFKPSLARGRFPRKEWDRRQCHFPPPEPSSRVFLVEQAAQRVSWPLPNPPAVWLGLRRTLAHIKYSLTAPAGR